MSERALDTSRAAAVDWRTSKPVTAPHAMVVSAQHLATEVGVEILKRGGNAIDAAVAVGYAEAVVHPCCGNIGGGGFMRSEEHTSELQSLMCISYAGFCLKKKK